MIIGSYIRRSYILCSAFSLIVCGLLSPIIQFGFSYLVDALFQRTSFNSDYFYIIDNPYEFLFGYFLIALFLSIQFILPLGIIPIIVLKLFKKFLLFQFIISGALAGAAGAIVVLMVSELNVWQGAYIFVYSELISMTIAALF